MQPCDEQIHKCHTWKITQPVPPTSDASHLKPNKSSSVSDAWKTIHTLFLIATNCQLQFYPPQFQP